MTAGHGMLSNCLTVSQLHVEQTTLEQPQENRGVTGPTTDLYTSKYTFYLSFTLGEGEALNLRLFLFRK